MLSGTELAWETLLGLIPDEVCTRALASYDTVSGAYALKFFQATVLIIPDSRRIYCPTTENDSLLKKLGSLPELQILSYLTRAQDIPLSGKLIKPADITGGLIYSKGTHVLPLASLAKKFDRKPGEFIRRGIEFGGEELAYGDASVRLFPFPRLPVILILWKGDDEIPSNISLLFDSTCEYHLPADILWSTALMSVQVID